jgi:flagellar hook-associated protein FlgK
MKTFVATIFCILFAGTFLTSFKDVNPEVKQQQKRVDSMIIQVDKINAQLKQIN